MAEDMTIGEKIGRLLALTEVLQADFSFMKEQVRIDADRADASRSRIHARLDDYLERMVSVEHDLSAQGSILNDVKEVTDEVVKWKAAGMGALGVTGLAAGSISAMLTAYWENVRAFFTGHI